MFNLEELSFKNKTKKWSLALWNFTLYQVNFSLPLLSSDRVTLEILVHLVLNNLRKDMISEVRTYWEMFLSSLDVHN